MSKAKANSFKTVGLERSAATRDRYVERTYGITADMYRSLEAWQGGRCYGCRRATGASRQLAVDHNHRTGEVRMLLCSPCNRILGHFRDDPVALIRLGLALVQPPSRVVWSQDVEPQWKEGKHE